MPAVNKFMADTSIAGPSLIVLGPGGAVSGALCMGWTGTDGIGRLNTALSLDEGATWQKTIVPTGDTSVAAPALAFHHEKLFMAWTGTDGTGLLNIMPSIDGGKSFQIDKKHFVSTSDGQEKSIAAPALISYRGLLLIAWTGTDGQGLLNIATSADEGATWQSKVVMPETAIDGPALTFLSGGVSGAGFTTLVVAWTGTDSDHHINTRTTSDTNFGQLGQPDFGKSTFPDTSNFGPSLTTAISRDSGDQFVIIAWTGSDSNRQLNCGFSGDGTTFGGKKTSSESSIAKPALVKFSIRPPDELVYAWTGTDGEGHLNFAPGPAIGLGFSS
jgi:hypothetical protein